MKLIFSFIVAILVPALMVSAWYLYGQFLIFEPDDPYIWVRTRKIVIASIIVSGGFVLILGIPAYFIMKRVNIIKWWSTLVVGFFLGAIPAAIFSWPVYPGRNFSASMNGVQTIVDGIPTLEGWMQYVYGFSTIGMLGSIGAFSFWLVWRNSPNKALKSGTPQSGAP